MDAGFFNLEPQKSFEFDQFLYEELDGIGSHSLSSPEPSVFDSPIPSPFSEQYPLNSIHPMSTNTTEFNKEQHVFYLPDTSLFHMERPKENCPLENNESIKSSQFIPVPKDYYLPVVNTVTPRIISASQNMDCSNEFINGNCSTITTGKSKKRESACEDKGTKRNRKRQKVSSGVAAKKILNDRDSVILTREELLSFSSEQYEEFVSQVTDVRDLTPFENNELKRQRRLIKNRESAQASRQRKKSHIDDLERRVKELNSENISLKDNLSAVSSENRQLKNDLSYLQAIVSNYKSAHGHM